MTVLPDPPMPVATPALPAPKAPARPRRRRLSVAAAFGTGATVMLAGVLGFNALQPAPDTVTPAQVDQAIAAALAAATPAAGQAGAATAYEAIAPSIVAVSATSTSATGVTTTVAATGFVLKDDGSVMTALHVVDTASSISLTYADGTTTTATVTTRTTESDTAVLTPATAPAAVTPATLGGGATTGSDVYVVASPYGLTASLSAGVISATDRSYIDETTGTTTGGLLQLDAAVNPGSEGGPVVNGEGAVVGVVVAVVNPTDADTFIGIGLAAPMGGGGAGTEPGAGAGAGVPEY
jgi:S1-C subfamily serine protease